MSQKELKEFFKKIEDEEAFRTELKNDEELKKNVPSVLIDLAKRKGFNFSIEEYIEYVNEARKIQGKSSYADMVSAEYLFLMKGCDSDTPSSCSAGNPSSGCNA